MTESKQLTCSIMDELKLYAYIVKLHLSKKKRNSKQVSIEYDKGIWDRKYEDVDFESIEGNYNKKSDQYSIFTINGKLFKGKYADYGKQYQKQLFKILDTYIDESVVELGCGLGSNLFQLHHRNFKKLEGYDLSENVINSVKRYNSENNYL